MSRLGDLGWSTAWRAARAAATPWMKRELAAKSLGEALTSSVTTATTERARDGWRLAARRR